MIFTSWTFLLFFIVLSVLLYVFKASSHRLSIMLVASYIFYGAWNVSYLGLIFASSLWGWGLGLMMVRAKTEAARKASLMLSLFLSMGMLGFYKYADFFANNIYSLLDIQRDESFDILLPVGISFFTFQTMSYTIDLYRGNLQPCYSLKKFMLFVAFFPQLVAGPIVRAVDFLPQLEKKIVFSHEDIILGAQIFLGGAIQKSLFADNLSVFVDPVFAEPVLYSSSTLWLALSAYSLQIFCDFAGYSLMAIGLARMLGFKLPPNFNMPYISASVTEFWRRWHISLSTWLRDYLYISLGGNKKGLFRTYANLFITMILGGLWHGASWNFVLWGTGHGLALAVHKYWLVHTGQWTFKENTLYRATAWGFTLIVVMLLWIPFRTHEFSDTVVYFSRLWGAGSGFDWYNTKSIIVLGFAAIWHLAFLYGAKWLILFPCKRPVSWYCLSVIILTLFIFLLLSPTDTSPFIYFQF